MFDLALSLSDYIIFIEIIVVVQFRINVAAISRLSFGVI